MSHTGAREPLRWRYRSDAEMLERSAQFLQLMRTRRTVRSFSPEPVPYDVVLNAIVVAGSAPSGANQQPWIFAVVTDPAIKARIREAAEAEERTSYGGRMSAEWLEALAPLGTDWHKPHLTDAPYLIVVFEQSYGLDADGTERKHYYARESVGIATGFLLAALHQAGLATLTHTPSPMGFLRTILGRPRNERAFLIVATGHPAPDCDVPVITKKALEQIAVRFDGDRETRSENQEPES